MEAKAARNVVKTIGNVLDEFQKLDKTGTVKFILLWFGVLIKWSLIAFPVLHMNIFYLIWTLSKFFGDYTEKEPKLFHRVLRGIATAWVPVTPILMYICFAEATSIFEIYRRQVVLYLIWWTWALTIPILWLIDYLLPKWDVNKGSLRLIGVKNVKVTTNLVGEEETFLWVSSLLALVPALNVGYFGGYLWENFINIGNAQDLSCQEINFNSNKGEDTLKTYNLCFDNTTLVSKGVCCRLKGISTESFLDIVVYLSVVIMVALFLVRFLADFVIRSEQIRNEKGFVHALQEQIEKVKSHANMEKDIDDEDIDDESDDEFELAKTASNLDLLQNDLDKIEKRHEKRKGKKKGVEGGYGSNVNTANDTVTTVDVEMAGNNNDNNNNENTGNNTGGDDAGRTDKKD